MAFPFKGIFPICRHSGQPKADAVIDLAWEIADKWRKGQNAYRSNLAFPFSIRYHAFVSMQGNYIDAFAKRIFGRVLVFTDFLEHYADKRFVSAIDTKQIEPAPTHYLGKDGDERIVDLVFHCPLKAGGTTTAVVVFEHQSGNLKHIPRKLHKYISAIWEAETKEGKSLSAPYFIVLRTGKRPHRKRYPTMADALPKDENGMPIGKMVELEYDVVDLPSWDFDKLVGGAVLRSALGMLHTMTGGHLDEFPRALLPLLELPDGEKVELTKELVDFVARAFAASNRRLDVLTVSKAVEPILRDRGHTMKTIFEEQQDIGRAQGKAEGKAEGKIETLLAILRKRFGRVPRETEKAVRSMSDPVALESWAVEAATCASLADFVKALR